MYEDFTISQAISQIEHLKSLMELKKEQKEKLFPLPKSGNMGELVEGGIRSDKMVDFLIRSNNIEVEIDRIEKEIKMLEKYVEKEKERISQYNEWEQKIIYMRAEHYSWLKIACSVPYSQMTCRRIYARYKKDAKRKNEQL